MEPSTSSYRGNLRRRSTSSDGLRFGPLLQDVKVIWDIPEGDGSVAFILLGKSAQPVNL